jgi:ribosomal protein S18 acetylase RimI-like enzyme
LLLTSNLTVYVGDAGDGVVGTASLLVMPNLGYECHPTAFIEAVAVDPQHRRLRVGTAIVGRILADAAEKSCRKVQLLSHKRHADDGAFSFYRSLGFEAEAEGFRRLDT